MVAGRAVLSGAVVFVVGLVIFVGWDRECSSVHVCCVGCCVVDVGCVQVGERWGCVWYYLVCTVV
jgi:hypothetical protein